MSTPENLLQELQSFTSVSVGLLTIAKLSKINEENNSDFRDLLDGWGDGAYDECPELLVDEISFLFKS